MGAGKVTAAQFEAGPTCMLDADAANPTSNCLYTRIGYEHVIDTVDITLRG